MIQFDATYDHGVFRPDAPVPLEDQARVQLIVSTPAPVESPESFYDAAARLGLIGTLHGGPDDLSTNPRHMEGFGGADR